MTANTSAFLQKKTRISVVFELLVLAPLIYFSCFWMLERPTMQHVDEAMHVRIVQELEQAGPFAPPTLLGKRYLNKPPFKMWLSVPIIKTLGQNKFAYRLPDAALGAATVLLTYSFARVLFASGLAGVLSALALMGCYNFFYNHVVRASTQDAMLVFLSTLALVSGWNFFCAAKDEDPNPSRLWRWALIGGAAAGCGVLTKSVGGFVPLGVLGLYALLSSTALNLLKRAAKPCLLVLGLALAIPALYYLPLLIWDDVARIIILEHEIMDRMSKGYHNPGQPLYFLKYLFKRGNAVPPVLLVVGLCWGVWQVWRTKDARWGFLLIWSISVVGLYSVIDSKLPHYIVPAFPAISILVGASVASIGAFATNKTSAWWGGARFSFPGTFAALFFLGAIGLLGYDVLKIGAVAASMRNETLFDQAIKDAQRFYRETGSRAPVEHYRAPAVPIFEISMLGMLGDRFHPVEKGTEGDDTRDISHSAFVISSPSALPEIWSKRPFSAYQFFPRTKHRDRWLAIAAFEDPSFLPHFRPTRKLYRFEDGSFPALFGFRPSSKRGKTRVRISHGSESDFVVSGDLVYRKLSSNFVFNLSRVDKRVEAIELRVNGARIGEKKLAGGDFHSYQFMLPAGTWVDGNNIVSIVPQLAKGEVAHEHDDTLMFNWISLRIGEQLLTEEKS